jgi:hypothetical protein
VNVLPGSEVEKKKTIANKARENENHVRPNAKKEEKTKVSKHSTTAPEVKNEKSNKKSPADQTSLVKKNKESMFVAEKGFFNERW